MLLVMKKINLIVCSIFIITDMIFEISASNILIVDNVPSPSHQIWNYGIVKALLERGHNITLLGLRNIDIIVHENLTMYELEALPESTKNVLNINKLHKYGVLDNIKLKNDYEISTCTRNLESPSLNAILNYPTDFFDLLIFDISFSCLLPLIKKFDFPPSIGITAFMIPKYISDIFGKDVNPSYEPFMYTTFSTDMNFAQRIQNYFFTYFDTYTWRRLYDSELVRVLNRSFGNHMLPLHHLHDHLSLLLCNLVIGFHYPRSLPPSVIPIGGVHLDLINKLPKDLQEIVDDSPHGIIIFSLGSNLNSNDMDSTKIRYILDAFSKLNETILWKITKTLENLPKNVILRKWLPQQELLAHNKTKLFISHCGGLSTVEAARFGVPILALPFMLDQNQNAEQIENQKWGKVLPFQKITTENIYDAIHRLLHDPEYRTNAQRMSRLVRDQTDSSRERAIYWIEYAIRHNGTRFLKPETTNSSFFIRYSLDILTFLTVLSIILTKSLITTSKFLITYCINRKVKVE
ncbi:UDP-glucosyltransferase 2-like isoform X2 [Diorhabda sublineata]|uniref:UDP-glucosyltransferase 2-like isoform X2 n=1 Tax=Diorhabda sublineata TaxID=1163346 RepID=UPI0024E11C36|nr:UDP-glucosyltransferase 2-like isoform X2 [Diorhabda sublineata]